MTRAVSAAVGEVAGPLYVGFSGGRDSLVLLHAVAACRRDQVSAVHVNHGLHRNAGSWEARCAAVAAELGTAFVARRVAVSSRGSLEAAARAARYRAFRALLAQAPGTLMLAHHRHDQTETVLLRLLQGRGIYGMPQRRQLGRGVLIRPLLNVDPQALDDYARAHGLDWIDDPGNDDLRLDRNFLRREVLPVLRVRFTAVDDALIEAMNRHAMVEDRLRRSLASEPASPLPLADVRRLEPAEAVEMLRLWLTAAAVAVPSRRALQEFLRQLWEGRRQMQPRLELDGGEVRSHGDALHLVRPLARLDDAYAVILPGLTLLPHGRLEVRKGDGFCPQGPVEIRFRRGGERILLMGRRRRLKTLLHDAGVAPWQRDRWPLLWDESGLLAVPGVAARDHDGSAGTRFVACWHPREVPESDV